MEPAQRQIRARYDEATITVYQAYSPEIASAAVAAGRFVPPFKMNRMTWIKPSFLWMMYRCGWATKRGQERVLAIRITREGFETALSQACLSHYEPDLHGDRDTWLRLKESSPVRVQWDPERDLQLNPLPWRSIQIGLSGPAAYDYVGHWVAGIDDITADVRSMHRQLMAGRADDCRSRLPTENRYLLPPAISRRLGVTT